MTLLDDVAEVCARLAPSGWRELLLAHGLDITAEDLRAELTKTLPVDRDIPGFEDFAADGTRGIEPGVPARSLLFHALASPNVAVGVDGRPLGGFPTLADVDKAENLVFGMDPPSLANLRARARGGFLAIAVFAVEYRSGPETVHRSHADLCFSRTGVSRVGNAPPLYDAPARGFTPFGDRAQDIRVLPSRFAAYVAAQLRPGDAHFGPMNLELRKRHPEFFQEDGVSDDNRQFWVPLHKLFSGPECILGEEVCLTLETQHVNEKLRRVHLELAADGHDTGWTGTDLDQVPFVFTEGIAEWSKDPDLGPGVLVPEVHDRLVEPATYRGRPLAFNVPPSSDFGLGPSLTIEAEDGFRRAPEYVHVRHQITEDGSVRDLNDEPDVGPRVFAGGYRALHYLDFSGDGWVQASVPELAVRIPRRIPAYSLVTAPDFYPRCDQRELMEWWIERVPTALRQGTWRTPPLTLSDERVAPNLTLPGVDFRPEDDTVTAIVSLPLTRSLSVRPLPMLASRRHPHLPDAAAGVFAPGWDTSQDRTNGTPHLAAYGLGSPFPEDAKLCAALSTFWPAVAPDAGRSFSTTFPTVSPLDDTEVGSVGDVPWDGVRGPRVVPGAGGVEVVEYASFDHVDYVRSALDARFSLAETGEVISAEYEARVLAMARSYIAAGLTSTSAKRAWGVLSFLAAEDGEVASAQSEAGTNLQGQVWAVELFRRGEARLSPTDHRLVHVAISERLRALVGALPGALVRRGQGRWEFVPTP